jgi:hypothetical protein
MMFFVLNCHSLELQYGFYVSLLWNLIDGEEALRIVLESTVHRMNIRIGYPLTRLSNPSSAAAAPEF